MDHDQKESTSHGLFAHVLKRIELPTLPHQASHLNSVEWSAAMNGAISVAVTRFMNLAVMNLCLPNALLHVPVEGEAVINRQSEWLLFMAVVPSGRYCERGPDSITTGLISDTAPHTDTRRGVSPRSLGERYKTISWLVLFLSVYLCVCVCVCVCVFSWGALIYRPCFSIGLYSPC